MVGAVHAIGHALGGVCHIAHGEAMAILMPHVMAFNRARNRALYAPLLPLFPGEEDPVEAVTRFVRGVSEAAGLPTRLRDTGKFDRSRVDEIAEKALNDGAMIVNPAYLSKEDVAQHNPLSDAFAFAAMRILVEKLPIAVGRNASGVRTDMAVAACMAGAAFGNSMVGAVHAIGHALGGVCHIAHGEAMAILMPHVMAFNRARNRALYAPLLPLFPGEEDPVEAVTRFVRGVSEAAGLPTRLRDTGKFDRSRVDEIAEKALNDGAMIVNPAYLSKEDVAQLLLRAE